MERVNQMITIKEMQARLQKLSKKMDTLETVARKTDNKYLLMRLVVFNKQMECAVCTAKEGYELFHMVEVEVDGIFNQMN